MLKDDIWQGGRPNIFLRFCYSFSPKQKEDNDEKAYWSVDCNSKLVTGHGLPCQAQDNVIYYGCYQKEHGQLRLVADLNECLASELGITFGTGIGIQNVRLECVTGELYYILSGSTNYCDDDHSLEITSPMPTEIEPEDVFEVYCESNGDDEVLWGLRCKDGWVNTGCSATSFEVSGELDIPQFDNGCYSDNEEYGNANIFTTCCRITVTTE